ncbi:MAG: hypothetical protein NZ954_00410 [Thermofilaceae archaeon]|nr:hypothetical protein [Thermofilaceae archaeon]MCX8180358.1 hypothetical protein [Thermofilaceae archaeon]MDW8003893.1 hypothetical protein [Thermofilaceae archaeon]
MRDFALQETSTLLLFFTAFLVVVSITSPFILGRVASTVFQLILTRALLLILLCFSALKRDPR